MVVKSYHNEDDYTNCDLVNLIKLVDDGDFDGKGDDNVDDHYHLHFNDLIKLYDDDNGKDDGNDDHGNDDHLHLNDLLNFIKLVGGKKLLHHKAFVARTVPLADHDE